LNHFGADLLTSGGGVIDIAAGKGALSTSLAARCGPLRCTLIEPAPRHCTSQLGPFCQLLALPFDHAFAECHSELLARSSIFVGLHPDQATEAVVVEALAHGSHSIRAAHTRYQRVIINV
jgi:hypothetical protein